MRIGYIEEYVGGSYIQRRHNLAFSNLQNESMVLHCEQKSICEIIESTKTKITLEYSNKLSNE
jgi:hypothetical protein